MRDISGRLPSLGIPEERPLLRRLPTLAWGLPSCALLLAVLGLSVVRSASTELAVDYLPRQAAWVAVGLAAMVVGFAIGHVTLLRMAVPLYVIRDRRAGAHALLRHEAGGAQLDRNRGTRRSARSDEARHHPGLVRYLGSTRHDRLRASELLVVAAVVALPAALLSLEHDLGGALILLPAVGAPVWLAGCR
jgi:cell division protein FtsW (lipid II flippase)